MVKTLATLSMAFVMGATGAMSVTAQELSKDNNTDESKSSYKVLKHTTSGNNVFVLYDPKKDSYPSNQPDRRTGLANIITDSYTLLAVDGQGKQVVCTGMKATLSERVKMDFLTGEKEAHDYLRPKTGMSERAIERSYGSCRPISLALGDDGDVKGKVEYNNARVNFVFNHQRMASVFVPIIGSTDLKSRQTPHNNPMAFYLGGWGVPACKAAGYNDSYDAAKVDQNIKISFCP